MPFSLCESYADSLMSDDGAMETFQQQTCFYKPYVREIEREIDKDGMVE